MNAFAGGGSSSESSDEGDDLLFPSTDPAADEFEGPRRKRRKTGRDAKESAALGIFGSESEDDTTRPGQRWKAKSLRGKGVGFVKSGTAEDEQEEGSDEEEEEDAEMEMGNTGVEETAGLRGLGWHTPKGRPDEQPQEARPSLGTPLGQGFVPSSAKQPVLNFAPPVDEPSTPKIARPSFTSPMPSAGNRGRGKGTPAVPSANPNSFAARMMAKMGYVAGQGLGTSGQGILNPVETKLRPQGVGLGAVREKTEQARAEARREAERRGEVVEDSSEEERKRRRRQKKEKSSRSGTSTPVGGRPKQKLKYRTAAEIEAAADGLEVPNVLKSIIDATGKEKKLLTSTSGLMTPVEGALSSESEAAKIARRARLDLEAFADEWNGLTERKKYALVLEEQLNKELGIQQEEIGQLRGVTEAVQGLSHLQLDQISDPKALDACWGDIVGKLETLEIEFRDEIEAFGLSEVAVAALHKPFQLQVEDWAPLQQPTHLVSHLQRLRTILGVKSEEDSNALALQNGRFDMPHQSRSTTFYETMIYSLWLPKIRSVITNDWDVHDPSPLISLIEAWKDLLPSFVYHNLIDQLIVQKLSGAVNDWNPRVSHHKKRRQTTLPPHVWLFPWLQYLDAHHTDPRSPTGLLADVKRKFRVVLDTWDISRGTIPGLQNWRDVLRRSEFDALLIRHLLPRLALHLQTYFSIDPSDQDLSPLEHVLLWTDFFAASVMAQLLLAEFFPKWHAILHLWLTSEPNYEEVGQWFSWWKARFPDAVNAAPAVAAEWDRGLQTMNLALDLGHERAKTELPPPAAGPLRPIKDPNDTTSATSASATHPASSRAPSRRDGAAAAAPDEPPTFRDVVEAWCAEQDLLLIPLREAHDQTGAPLFRITASANGKGGVLVYLKGDVVWAASRRDRSVWEPVGLEDGLVARAEGR
ncbi:MAG: hypothetical protein M1819_005543 [Sarea resinae]|nr:MAG: hypothetical protein M1819_005543 [Sarea resinae]